MFAHVVIVPFFAEKLIIILIYHSFFIHLPMMDICVFTHMEPFQIRLL